VHELANKNLSGSSHSLYEVSHAIQSFDQINRGGGSDTIMTTIEIPMPHWAEKAGAMS